MTKPTRDIKDLVSPLVNTMSLLVSDKTTADGTGYTPVLDVLDLIFSKRIPIRQASDFGTIDSTVLYVIDGNIDMGTTELEVPSGGIQISGHTAAVSSLFSSANNYTLFTSPVGGSGAVNIFRLGINISGTSSKVYDLVGDTGNELINLNTIAYRFCTSLGTINGFGQGVEQSTIRIGGTPDLTLAGTWVAGYTLLDSVSTLIDNAMSVALFRQGVSFSMAGRFRSDATFDLGTLAAFMDFTPADFPNPSTLQLQSCFITRNGVADGSDATILPNILPSDLPSDWHDNVGIGNTFEGGIIVVSTQTTTVIGSIGVFVDINATAWTPSDLQHFDNPANGELRHIGDDPREYNIIGDFTIQGTAEDELVIRMAITDSSGGPSTSFVNLQTRVVNNFVGGTDRAFFTFFGTVTLDKNDFVFLQIANNTSTDNVIAEDGSQLRVSAR